MLLGGFVGVWGLWEEQTYVSCVGMGFKDAWPGKKGELARRAAPKAKRILKTIHPPLNPSRALAPVRSGGGRSLSG